MALFLERLDQHAQDERLVVDDEDAATEGLVEQRDSHIVGQTCAIEFVGAGSCVGDGVGHTRALVGSAGG